MGRGRRPQVRRVILAFAYGSNGVYKPPVLCEYEKEKIKTVCELVPFLYVFPLDVVYCVVVFLSAACTNEDYIEMGSMDSSSG